MEHELESMDERIHAKKTWQSNERNCKEERNIRVSPFIPATILIRSANLREPEFGAESQGKIIEKVVKVIAKCENIATKRAFCLLRETWTFILSFIPFVCSCLCAC